MAKATKRNAPKAVTKKSAASSPATKKTGKAKAAIAVKSKPKAKPQATAKKTRVVAKQKVSAKPKSAAKPVKKAVLKVKAAKVSKTVKAPKTSKTTKVTKAKPTLASQKGKKAFKPAGKAKTPAKSKVAAKIKPAVQLKSATKPKPSPAKQTKNAAKAKLASKPKPAAAKPVVAKIVVPAKVPAKVAAKALAKVPVKSKSKAPKAKENVIVASPTVEAGKPASKRRKDVTDGVSGFKPYRRKSNEDYMNEAQKEHFRGLLRRWKSELMFEVDRTVNHMKDEAANFPDPADRATQEEEFSLELRTRDRERKLIKKIESTMEKIDQDDYGWCNSCGIEIGVQRLEVRPTATLCIDCKTLDEIKEKQERG